MGRKAGVEGQLQKGGDRSVGRQSVIDWPVSSGQRGRFLIIPLGVSCCSAWQCMISTRSVYRGG